MPKDIIDTDELERVFWARQKRRGAIIRTQEEIKGLYAVINIKEDFIARMKTQLKDLGGSYEDLE